MKVETDNMKTLVHRENDILGVNSSLLVLCVK